MANFVDIGVSALKTAQQQLNTTSHNISNVNTQSYSRQTVVTGTRFPEYSGAGYFGTGVEAKSVVRSYDSFVADELRINMTNDGYFNKFEQLTGRVDNLLADPATGISSAIQDYFSAMHAVADDPTSIPARDVFLSQANVLANRFETLSGELLSQQQSINEEIKAATQEISQIGENLARVNVEIRTAYAASNGAPPNDLLDKRDALLQDLSELVAVNAVQLDDGMMNVYVGNGQPIVLGSEALAIQAARSDTDLELLQVVVASPNGSSVNVSSNISGGKLGAILDFQSDILQKSLNSLGQLAMGVAETTNAQHQLGMDLNGNIGGDLFTDYNDAALAAQRVFPSTKNTSSTVDMAVYIDDATLLTDSDYQLTFNAGNYTLTRLNDGTNVATFAEPAAAGLPTTIAVASEGFSFEFNGVGAADGDFWAIKPTRIAAQRLDVEITDPRLIAAASPVRTDFDLNNTGTGTISAGVVTDTANAAFSTTANVLTDPILIQFNSATDFDIINANTAAVLVSNVAFTPDQENDILQLARDQLTLAGLPIPAELDPGYSFNVGGAPATGDSFSVDYNTMGVGDNRNIVALTQLQTTKTLASGSATYQENYTRLVANIGARGAEAKINAETSSSLLRSAQERRDNMSGVNLDEEAANLIQFQQIYQAAARIISVSDTIFQSILRAAGG